MNHPHPDKMHTATPQINATPKNNASWKSKCAETANRFKGNEPGCRPLQSERAMQLERDRWQLRDEDQQRQYSGSPYHGRGNFDGNPK